MKEPPRPSRPSILAILLPSIRHRCDIYILFCRLYYAIDAYLFLLSPRLDSRRFFAILYYRCRRGDEPAQSAASPSCPAPIPSAAVDPTTMRSPTPLPTRQAQQRAYRTCIHRRYQLACSTSTSAIIHASIGAAIGSVPSPTWLVLLF